MADKLRMASADIVDENIEFIASRWPNAVMEVEVDGKLSRRVDFDVLKQELSKELISDKQERYVMTWPDKKNAILLANQITNNTIRPNFSKSKDFFETSNVYIEGDNLDVLKILRETYLEKIKVIYIDPPYNTGGDLIYEDDFSLGVGNYLGVSGQIDESGNKLISNPESCGRYHTNWLNMMFPRIKLAKDLLKPDGVIFISIDDNELDNLKKICDEVFGMENFVGCISRATGTTTGQDANKIGSSLDYCLVYSKSSLFSLYGLPLSDDDRKRFSCRDSKGDYSMLQLRKTGSADRREDRPNMFFPVKAPDGSDVYPFGPDDYLSRWRVGKDSYLQLEKDDMIVWKKTDDKEITIDGYRKSVWVPYVKYYSEGRTKQVSNLIENIEGNKKASLEIKELLGGKYFDNPKPVEFIKILLQISSNSDDIIMDFFSGSATTAQAMMETNSDDGKKRHFILVQLPEKCEESTEAYKAGYKTICEIGEDRVNKAGEKIKQSAGLMENNLDIGFRVFRLDSSNMKDVYYNPSLVSQSLLEQEVDNVKDDRTPFDLLFQVMLEMGIELSAHIDEKEVNGKKFYVVNDSDLVACFDEDVNDDIVKAIAEIKPIYAVFRDSSFKNDSSNINCEQLFKVISPATEIKVI